MLDKFLNRKDPKPEPSNAEIAKQRAGRFGALGAVIGGALVAKDVLTASSAQAQEKNFSVKELTPKWKAYLDAKRGSIDAHNFLGDEGVNETKYLMRDLIKDHIPSDDKGRVGGERPQGLYFYTESGVSYQYVSADGEMEWRKFGFVGNPESSFYIDYVYSEGFSMMDSKRSGGTMPFLHIYDSAHEFHVAIDVKTGDIDEFTFRKQNDAKIQETLGIQDGDLDSSGWSSRETSSGFIHYLEGLKDSANADRYVMQTLKDSALKSQKLRQFVNGLLQHPFAKV